MTTCRPVPFSAKSQRAAARAAIVARCVAVQPPARDWLLIRCAAFGFVFALVLL